MAAEALLVELSAGKLVMLG